MAWASVGREEIIHVALLIVMGEFPMNSQDNQDPETRAGVVRWVVRGLVAKLVVALIIFLAAGRLDWVWGWVYVGIFIAFDVATVIVVVPRSPGLLAERSAIQPGTKSWDQILVRLGAAYLPMAAWVVAGLDVRYGWTDPFPTGVHITAVGITLLGYAVVVWAMAANPFFSTTVRIQAERGHTVATEGPYRFIRHPGYAGAILFQLAGPLMLGSIWALIPMVLSVPVYVIRTILEDRTLQIELPGYRAYVGRVRYRLIPRVW
jgi:protein-S-isoprenylcysteine O-methyltransferase Ste14